MTYFNWLGVAMPESQTPAGHSVSRPAHDGPEPFSVPDNTGWLVSDNSGTGMGDTITGGGGDETYFLGDRTQSVVEAAGGGIDTVSISDSYILPANVENLNISNGSPGQPIVPYGVGNSGDNLIIATANQVQLDGAAGDDVLVDNAGDTAQVIFIEQAGEGHDVFYGFKTTHGASPKPVDDVVRLQGWNFTSFDQIEAALSPAGPDVKLTAPDGTTIIFRNHAVSDFTAANFQINISPSVTSGQPIFDEEFANGLSLRNPYPDHSGPSVGNLTADGTFRADFGYQGIDGRGSYQEVANNESQAYISPYFRAAGLGLTPFSVDPTTHILTIHPGRVSDLPAQDQSAFTFPDGVTEPFTSGLLTTNANQDGTHGFEHTFGYFEINAALPSTAGTWPAFWLLPGSPLQGAKPTTPEFDILEQFGDKNSYSVAIHGPNSGDEGGFANVFTGPLTGFHKYGLLWDPQHLTFTFDGVVVFQENTPADFVPPTNGTTDHTPMYLLTDLALGGAAGPVDAAHLAQAGMQIQSIKVWDLGAGSPPPGGQTITGDGTKIKM